MCDTCSRPAETPLMTLSTAETFVVVSLRLWFAGQSNSDAGIADWREGFTRANLCTGAVVAFDMLLRVVGTRNRHGLDVRWPCCSRLGADEAMLLHCLELMQSGRLGEVYAALHDWLCPCALNIAAGLLEQLAQFLADAGLILSDGPDGETCGDARQIHNDCGVPTLH